MFLFLNIFKASETSRVIADASFSKVFLVVGIGALLGFATGRVQVPISILLPIYLAQFGIDLEEELFNAIGAISTALLAVILILFAIVLFWNGVKITKKEIEINFDTRRFSSILSAKS